jgi:hypothetical protein
MDRARIVTALDAASLEAMTSTLREMSRCAVNGTLARTRSDQRIRPGTKVPADRIGSFWYTHDGLVLRLDHERDEGIRLSLEDQSGTRVVHLDGVLPKRLTRSDCGDPRKPGGALARLTDALAQAEPASDNPIRRVAEIIAESRPEGVRREISVSAPGLFRKGSIGGMDSEGGKVVRDSELGRRFLLERLGRHVLVDVPDPMRRSWRIVLPRASASSTDPDPIARLRLAAEAAAIGGPAMEAVPIR